LSGLLIEWRRGIRVGEQRPETRFEAGDMVVVLGEPDSLAAAEIRLLQRYAKRKAGKAGLFCTSCHPHAGRMTEPAYIMVRQTT